MDADSPLHAEIRGRLGVLPNFFRLAPADPRIAGNLWEFAKFAYLDNPLSPVFKERLFVSLSRFCEVRYCISRHVGFLVGLGRPAGDSGVPPETIAQAVELLRRPLPGDAELEAQIECLTGRAPAGAPVPGSALEEAIFDCAAQVFLQSHQAPRCLEALSRAFEPALFQHLLLFITFVRAAHFWTVVHPELELETDISELLQIQEALAQCVLSRDTEPDERFTSLLTERDTLRRERALRLELEQTNAALQAESERLRVTLSSIGDAVMTTDEQGRLTSLNPAAEALTGWAEREALGLPLHETFRLVEATSREPVSDPISRLLQEGMTEDLAHDVSLIARDGTEHQIDGRATPIRDSGARIAGCVLIYRDISEQRNAEKERSEKHEISELLAAIVDSSDDAIISKSLGGVIRTWNRAAERLFGYPAEEAIGSHITMIIPPELVGEEDMIISKIRAGERIDHYDTVRLRKDGRPVEISVTISPVKDERGRVIGASKTARDVSARKRAELELQRYARRLADADQQKDKFLAILAHELRNPLSPIRSCIQLLKAGVDGTEPLDIMDRQVNQMVRLIDDLLDVSRISRGKLVLRKGATQLREVLQGAVEAIQPMVDRGGYLLELDLPGDAIAMQADEARLVQVFTNLLTNAAKYSDPGSRIAVRARVDGNCARVTVTDEGVGIAADEIDSIFELFRQLESARHEAQGLGIGLTMARDLVVLHGGTIEALSEGPGQGSTFAVTLPVTDGSASIPTADAPAEVAAKAGIRVLVVDDSRDSATAMARLLSVRGCVVREAFGGREALQVASSFLPAAIILDIGMPDMNGLETARHIRSAPWGREVLLVALSGWGQTSDREKSRQAGFNEHLIKPANPEDLDRILALVDSSSAS